MNATNLDELRKAATARDPSDQKMEQVRQLLFGDYMRLNDTRLAALELRQRDFERTVTSRLEALAARIETLAAESGSGRRAAFDELSRSVLELGDRIRHIAKD
jgi:hypothetical protein